MEGWARVSASCDYFASLRYPEVFEIRLLVAEMRGRSITYIGEVYKEGADQPAARARWTVVRIQRAPGEETMRSADIPQDVASLLTVAPPDRLPDQSPRQSTTGESAPTSKTKES
jgi:acyl-CoA thioesterase FadM